MLGEEKNIAMEGGDAVRLTKDVQKQKMLLMKTLVMT